MLEQLYEKILNTNFKRIQVARKYGVASSLPWITENLI